MFLIIKKKNLILGLVICIFLIFIGLFSYRYFMAQSKAVLGKAGEIIIIDAGHGGRDPGAVVNNVKEKDINLDVAKRVCEFLEKKGCNVVMTRINDTYLTEWKVDGSYQRASLLERARIAKVNQGAVLISIHCNSTVNNSYYGPQTFFFVGSTKGKLLAEAIQKELTQIRPNKRRPVASDYYLLKNSHCTAVIVELGYLSNVKDRLLLKTPQYRNKMAEAIGRGILWYK